MNKQVRRLLLALVISTTCFVATVVWFNAGKSVSRGGSKSAVARLNENSNEVQRKPLKRVIWENINTNEELFAGEAIRTASNAEAKILFLKNGTTIHLEPDSLVVLEENDKGLTLDFLQGNLFVQSNSAAGSEPVANQGGITLKTNGGEIKLKSADMSLSRDQSGKVNLEVHRGSAELQQGSQTLSLDKDKAAVLSGTTLSVAKDRIQVLAPSAGEALLVNASRGEKIDVSWQPVPAGYVVEAEIGPSRSALKKISMAAVSDKSNLQIAQKPGKWFLRLTAKSSDPAMPPMASSIVPFTVETKNPPTPVEPTTEAAVLREKVSDPVKFRWANRHVFQSQVIEVASDANFKTVVQKKVLDGTANDSDIPLSDGKFFWRVTGFLKIKDKVEGLSSAPVLFTANSNWEVKPPILLAPANDSRLSFVDVQKSGLTVKWQAPAGVKRFQVFVQKQSETGLKTVYDQVSLTTVIKLTDLMPGKYIWKVSSWDDKSGTSKAALPFDFTIDEVPRLEWAEGLKEDYEFSTPQPSLAAQWKALPFQTTYRYRITPVDEPADANGWQTTKTFGFDSAVPNEGRYQVTVEAQNGAGQTVAATDAKFFNVKRRPLLPPPVWANSTPPVIKADTKGNLSMEWQPVDGAHHYLMVLQTPQGQVVEERPVQRNTASINRMKPGEYQVILKSVDGLKRPGLGGEAKTIQVPDNSDIRAPKIKSMKVK